MIYAAFPESSHKIPIDQSALRAKLLSLGFLGECLGNNSFLSGERFFDHISFLGFAPNLPLTPDEGHRYLRTVLQVLDHPALYTRNKMRPVVCPACDARTDRWVEHIDPDNRAVLNCPECAKITPLHNKDFHKRACFARTIIQILPVLAVEAIPADSFINTLSLEFDVAFKSAFVQA